MCPLPATRYIRAHSSPMQRTCTHRYAIYRWLPQPDWMLKSRVDDRVASIWIAYVIELYRKIERQEIDLIMVSS
jgi:hypothetical protein